MTPQQLKNSILQRAIEGRLVEQRPEEGTAQDLLKDIQTEKKRLIDEKKIKKSKALPPITEEEKPFDIPEGWAWVRFVDIFEIARGGSPRPIKEFLTNDENGINWIKIGDTEIGGKYIKSTKEKIIPDGIKKSRLVKYGDLLLTNSMSYGRPYIMQTRGAIHDGWLVLSPYFEDIDKDFFYYLISSPYVKNEFANTVAGAVVKNLNKDKVKEIFIPLPPLAEQHRIVAKIEELLPLIDKYDKAYTKLTDFNTRFPEAMKKSLLQYAIQGKLVEQRADEGTAQDLLKDIQAEKKRLIDEKKIKKNKALPPITEEEIPFDIPEGWAWVRLLDIAEGGLGKTLNKSKDKGIEKPYLCSINVYWDGIKLEKVKTALFDEEAQEKYLLKKGDLLICEGGDAGRSAVWENEDEMYYQNALHRIRFHGGINPYYFLYCLELFKAQGVIEAHCKGVTIKHLVQSSLNEIIFPLPPLSEQHRIVAKLEKLLPFCNQLRSKQN